MLLHTDGEVTTVYCKRRLGVSTSYNPTSKDAADVILHSSINHHPHLLDTNGRRYTGDYTFTRFGRSSCRLCVDPDGVVPNVDGTFDCVAPAHNVKEQ